MNRSFYLTVLCMAAATGAAAGMLVHRKRPAAGALAGAAAGALAGAAAAGLYEKAARKPDIPFYSSSSPLYNDNEPI